MKELPLAFEGLSKYRQFVNYMLVPSIVRPGSTDKIPVDAMSLRPINPHDSDQWLSADQALQMAAKLQVPGGVGFVFTSHDPFFFLDIDKCLVGNVWSPRALQLREHFAGAAVEVSQSGKGLHIIGSGVCPPHGCKNKEEGLELYTQARFVALTGEYAEGSVEANMTARLPWLVESFFSKPEHQEAIEWSCVPVPEWNGPRDDDMLIQKACSTSTAQQVFGNKASFLELFTGDEEALAKAYPDNYGSRIFDASSADMALALHLAFWTGKDCERMKNLMFRSKLVRDKWDREKYLTDTILNACKMQGNVYSSTYRSAGMLVTPSQAVAALPASLPDHLRDSPVAEQVAGTQFMPASTQIEHFKGCIYVRSLHGVLTPDGTILRPDQFRAMYSGYTFALDMANSKTTKSAWEAFIESQAFRFPKASRHVFRPELPPLKIFEEEGEIVVNKYVPVETPMRKGDPTPFLRLVEKMLPDMRDREILLSYMAACVQYKGHKFRWCPIVQGCEGNGKTTLARCVAFAIGYRYSHFPSAQDVANKFNSWIAEKMFIGINEIYIGDQRDMRDTLYPLISEDEVEVQRKGQDKERADNRANFFLTTNHKDAVRVTDETRRWAMFFTGQQSKTDKEKAGMTGSFFPHLYRWLKAEGFEIVNQFLSEYTISPEFNPAGACVEAPRTSAVTEAKALAVGSVEQEVLEAIMNERPGFRRGWVSSLALERLLEERRMAKYVPRNRRREMMQTLGYDWHPVLKPYHGRVTTMIMPESGKPILFRRRDMSMHARDAMDVRAIYMADQLYPQEVPLYTPGVM